MDKKDAVPTGGHLVTRSKRLFDYQNSLSALAGFWDSVIRSGLLTRRENDEPSLSERKPLFKICIFFTQFIIQLSHLIKFTNSHQNILISTLLYLVVIHKENKSITKRPFQVIYHCVSLVEFGSLNTSSFQKN